MGDVGRRLARLEEKFGDATCACSDNLQGALAILVIKDDWGPEQIELAAASAAQFTCPTHGPRLRPLLRLTQSDAEL